MVSAVKAVALAEAIGVGVPAQVVAEPRIIATVVSAVKAVLLTLLRRIEEDAAEKHYYIDSSSMPCSKVGLPHLAADGVRRTSSPSQKHCQSAESGTSLGLCCIRVH